MRKLFEFAKQTEGLSGEELVQACLDAGVGVIVSRGYNPFHGRSDDERREWLLFILWLTSRERAPGDASDHVEWLLRRAGNAFHFPARLQFPLKNVTGVTDSCAKARDGPNV